MRWIKDLVAASATPITLSVLNEADSYGYAILQRDRERSNGAIEWKEGMLYPLLHRLEDAGLIDGYDGTGPTGRKRRYYRITEKGRRQLDSQRSSIRDVAAFLGLTASPTIGMSGV